MKTAAKKILATNFAEIYRVIKFAFFRTGFDENVADFHELHKMYDPLLSDANY